MLHIYLPSLIIKGKIFKNLILQSCGIKFNGKSYATLFDSLLLQSAGQKDYIVHLAKTPPPLSKNVVEETLISSTAPTEQANTYIRSVKDIPMSWVADHAKHVCVTVLGIIMR